MTSVAGVGKINIDRAGPMPRQIHARANAAAADHLRMSNREGFVCRLQNVALLRTLLLILAVSSPMVVCVGGRLRSSACRYP
jgi:hypothetical protein